MNATSAPSNPSFFQRVWSAALNQGAVLVNRATVAVAGLSHHVAIARADVWRQNYNPLRGLTMPRAVAYLEDGERGAYADLQWLYRFIEKRDATLRGGKRSLLSAVSGMDWEIKEVAAERLPAGYSAEQAKAQAITLRTAYDAIANLTDAIEWLGLAEFRGFAHLEKVVNAAGQVTRLEPVEQWYWCRNGLHGEWQYNPRAASGSTRGEEVDLARFIVREIDDPINEIALIAFVRKQLGRKDEDGFIEGFGIPSIFAIMPQNVPQGEERKYQELAEQVIGDSRGALPHGSDIKTVDAGARGVAPFRAYQEALDKEIVLAITSGQLTMLAESGTGTLGGGAHSDTFMRVARALAKRITSCFQEQMDLQILAAAHPGQPPLAYFEILANEETDVGEVVKDVSSLKAAGYVVEPGHVEEKTGYPVTLAAPAGGGGEAAPGHGKPPALPAPDLGNRSPGLEPVELGEDPDEEAEFLAAALEDLGAAMQADCAPVAARLQEILSAGDDLPEAALRAKLGALQAELPDLAAQVAASDDTVKVWEAVLAAALGNQLSDEEEEQDA